MPAPSERFHITVEEIAEKLRNARKDEVRASLLIGAGCSVSAGIPACPKLIERIQSDFPHAYARAKKHSGGDDPNYGECMAVLDSGERRNLIEGYVRTAKINWAHLAIACLMAEGYVDRVLTTNFDNLVVRAAALLSIFPGVYDMTLYRSSAGEAPLQWDALPKHSIFHLHGQSTGFQLLNTDEAMEKHAPQVGDCFRFSEAARPWIVVGYSGQNDPIFRAHIGSTPHFARSLYWVGYQDDGLPVEVHDSLFTSDKDARFVGGTDADLFFIRLGQELGIFPPRLISDPLGHVLQVLDLFTPFPEPKTDVATNVLDAAKGVVQSATKAMSPSEPLANPSKTASKGKAPSNRALRLALASQASTLRLRGDYQGVIDLYNASKDPERSAIRSDVAAAFFQLGRDAQNRSEMASAEARVDGLEKAIAYYRQATDIQPRNGDALYNWGTALAGIARLVTEPERGSIWEQAIDKYKRALKVEPDLHEALYNWGNALSELAGTAPEPKPRTLREDAIEKYERAIRIKPDKYLAWNNWGNVLTALAGAAAESESRSIWLDAVDKYERAVAIRPDMYQILDNWGVALGGLARSMPSAERETVIRVSIGRFRRALEIKPDYLDAVEHLGLALGEVAKYAPEAERKSLERESKERLMEAERLKRK